MHSTVNNQLSKVHQIKVFLQKENSEVGEEHSLYFF